METKSTVRRDGTVVCNGQPIGRVERQLDGRQIQWEAFAASGVSLGRSYAKRLAVGTVCLMGKTR